MCGSCQKRTILATQALKYASVASMTPGHQGHRMFRRRIAMITMSVLLMLFVGLWLAVALIGTVFKLTFALVGGLFHLIGAVLGLVFGGLALLIVAPIIALAVLPFCLPVILLVAVIWAIARSSHRTATPANVAH
jgi:hypothetical protein